MNKKLMAVILAAVLAISAAAITGCGEKTTYITDTVAKLASSGDKWSVFVYMCGSSLEGVGGNASNALKSMMNVDYTENINVVVETGGALKWEMDCIDTNYLDRFEIVKDGMYLAERAEEDNMAKSTTLTDFLNWGEENYPADHYALIVWGYGGGSTGGVLYDEKYGNDAMTTQRLSYAISESPISFDLVGLDSGLMGSLECASSLALNADYMVASQEIMQGCGWDYASWLTYLTEHPLSTAEALGRQICDSYYLKCEEQKTAETATLSVINLDEISTLTQAFDGMAGAMLAATDSFDDYARLSSAMTYNVCFGANSEEEGYTNMVDMGVMADNVSDISDGTSELVHDALEKTVVYRVNGKYRSDASGISVFYPTHQDEDEIKKYLQNTSSVNYNDFIRRSCANVTINDGNLNYRSSWAFACYNNEMAYLKTETKRDGDCYELDMTGNMDVVKSVSLEEYYYDENSERYIYIGERGDIEENTEAGIFKNTLSSRILTLNGNFVTMTSVSSGNGYEILSVPAVVNGVKTNIRVVCGQNSEGEIEYKILGTWDGINHENGMAERNVRKITVLSRVAPVYRIHNSNSTTLSSMFVVNPLGMKFSEKNMKDGRYILQYRIKYIYDNEAYSDPANISIENKHTSFSE